MTVPPSTARQLRQRVEPEYHDGHAWNCSLQLDALPAELSSLLDKLGHAVAVISSTLSTNVTVMSTSPFATTIPSAVISVMEQVHNVHRKWECGWDRDAVGWAVNYSAFVVDFLLT